MTLKTGVMTAEILKYIKIKTFIIYCNNNDNNNNNSQYYCFYFAQINASFKNKKVLTPNF